jgi:hypothetical protein
LLEKIIWKVVAISPYDEHMPKLVPSLAEHMQKIVILGLSISENWLSLG